MCDAAGAVVCIAVAAINVMAAGSVRRDYGPQLCSERRVSIALAVQC